MKKIVLLGISLLVFVVVLANEPGHFFVDLSEQKVPVTDITNSLSNYVDVAKGSTFTLFRDTTDRLGIRHQSYQQYYQGTKVQSRLLLVHSMNGMVHCLNGAVMTNSMLPQKAPVRISPRQAASKASMHIPDSCVSRILWAWNGKFYHVYKVPSPQTFETLYIDVTSGQVIYRESAFRSADVMGRGYTRYNGWQDMTVFEKEGKYYLKDEGRNILTLSAEAGSPDTAYYLSAEYIKSLPQELLDSLQQLPMQELSGALIQYTRGPMMDDYIQNTCVPIVSDEKNFYKPLVTANGIEKTPSEYADIHWGMQKTLDFYKHTFNRNSFDGKGHIVINLAFPPHDGKMFTNLPNNAAAQEEFEPYFMFYGAGDNISVRPVVALDVMAHELTHMVTRSNGNGGLEYLAESGALNESFSDIMAMGAVQYTLGTCPWSIGADVVIGLPNARSLSDPKNSKGAGGDSAKGAQPDTYHGLCWRSTEAPSAENDHGGVHINSGVQNYWFYLLTEGGSGTNDNQHTYTVSGIGMDKALQIAFRNLLYYLVPCATYEDARNGARQATIDLHGESSQELQSVENAWKAVGVGNDITTGMESPSKNDQSATGKWLRNGQIYLIYKGTMYNVQGKKIGK